MLPHSNILNWCYFYNITSVADKFCVFILHEGCAVSLIFNVNIISREFHKWLNLNYSLINWGQCFINLAKQVSVRRDTYVVGSFWNQGLEIYRSMILIMNYHFNDISTGIRPVLIQCSYWNKRKKERNR